MNLTIHAIVKAHADKIANACSSVHERLMSMDQNRIVPDEQMFVDSIIGNELIDIPISVLETPVTVSHITAAIAERIAEIEGDIMLTNDGRTFVDNEWVNASCWKLEKAERGENDPVTVGARPVTLRTLALIQAERTAQDIACHIVETQLRPRWAEGLRNMEDEVTAAQELIDTIVPNITQTEIPEESTILRFASPEGLKGHPREVMIDFSPGQIIGTVTILLDWDDEAQEAQIAELDDDKVIISRTFPEAVLTAASGKPLETLFDHEYIRGLGLVIEGHCSEEEQTSIFFRPADASPLAITNAPSNWWITSRECY